MRLFSSVRAGLRRSRARTVVVAAVCFILGAIAFVRAESVPKGRINALADAKDVRRTARVNGSGELAVTDLGVREELDLVKASLARITYALEGGVKVTPQGTTAVAGTVTVGNLPAVQEVHGSVQVTNQPAVQAVSGTVAVSNLPATQEVKIVGGDVTTAPRLADRDDHTHWIWTKAENPRQLVFSQIALAAYSLEPSGSSRVWCSFKGRDRWEVPLRATVAQTFPFPIVVDSCHAICEEDKCRLNAHMVGFDAPATE